MTAFHSLSNFRPPGSPGARRSIGLFIAVAIALMAAVLPVSPASSQTGNSLPESVQQNDSVRIVIDDPDVAQDVADSLLGTTVVIDTDLFSVVETSPDQVDKVLQEAESRGEADVEFDQPAYLADNSINLANVAGNDPWLPSAWGLTQMDVPGAWINGTGNVTIAIIDTGVATVSELSGRVLPGQSYIAGQAARVSPNDGNDDVHGTAAAVVAAGALNNNVAAAGSCPTCTILPIRVFAQGSESASMADVAAGVIWAADNGADIISMSLGGDAYFSPLETAATYAYNKGVVLLGAAGNSGSTTAFYPGALSNVINVGAITPQNTLYNFSNRGNLVDFAAGGCNYSQDDNGGVVDFCGTSSATPLLAGAVALARSKFPDLSPAQIYDALVNVRTPVPGIAGGRIDAAKLLSIPPIFSQPTGPAANPVGSIEKVRRTTAGMRVIGWVYDPNTDRPVQTLVRQETQFTGTIVAADKPRPDLLWPSGLSNKHGIDAIIPSLKTASSVCVTATNMGPGSDVTLPCSPLTTTPSGEFELVIPADDGSVAIATGWALDPDGDEPASIRIYRPNGVTLATVAPTVSRPDVAANYDSQSTTYGFTADLFLGAGIHTICAAATIPAFPHLTTKQLGCQIVTLPDNAAPALPAVVGSLDALTTPRPGVVVATGWALEANGYPGVTVRLRQGLTTLATVTPSENRPDVNSVYPTTNPPHGFTATINMFGGNHTICADALFPNTLPVTLGCSTVSLPGGNPMGSLDTVSQFGPNTIRLGGWAVDPDTANDVAVHVYANGRFAAALTANTARPDVGAAYPAYGNNHGFAATVPLTPGSYQVCAYGINIGTGTVNSLLGCRNVTIRSGSPVGSFDVAAQNGPSNVRFRGWALDFDTSGPVPVHVYVDGRWGGAFTANTLRTDVGRAFSGFGNNHGFSADLALPGGTHTICAYAINVGAGANNPLLGCRNVIVRTGTPTGSVDNMTRLNATQVQVDGWALDFDTVGPVPVHVYVNGRWGGAFTANTLRTDVGKAFSGFGNNHGMSFTVTAAGPSDICIYTINAAGPGGNSLLGCRRA